MESNSIFQNCETNTNLSSFCIYADTETTAMNLVTKRLNQVAKHAVDRRRCEALIYYPGCGTPFQVPSAMAVSSSNESCSLDPFEEAPVAMPPNPNLLGASYLKILEFLQEQRENGNIVIITSNITRDDRGNVISTDSPAAGRDLCHHSSDLLKPSRAFWSASQFSGYNYRLSWRRGFDDYEGLNPQYHRLKELLERDGVVQDYEYTLYRPDGAKCSYSTTYHYCDDYCGDPVRVGVSRPQDWSLIEPAPQIATIR